MKLRVKLILFCLVIAVTFTALVVVGQIALALQQDEHTIGVIAHRGYWNTESSAENSISSLQNAESILCYGSECDVHLTADNKLIVIHGPKHGEYISDVREATFEDIRTHLLANNELVPSFEEYLDAYKNTEHTKLIIEIKDTGDALRNLYLTEQIISLVSSYDIEERVEYISFNRMICDGVLNLRPDADVYYLGGDMSPSELKLLGYTGLDYNIRILQQNPHWIEEAHELGLLVIVWEANNPDAQWMEWAIDNDVDYITTDFPVIAQEMILEDKHSLHSFMTSITSFLYRMT